MQRLALLALILAAPGASATDLVLTHERTLDLSTIPLASIGDLAYLRSPERICVADGANGGVVHRLDPLTGALDGTIDPSAVPSLAGGPDAIAFDLPSSPPNDVFVFSSFGESRGGLITQAGVLVDDFGTSHGATGADMSPSGALWVATGIAAGAGTTLRRLNPSNGSVLQSVPLLGVTQRASDVAFDPFSGALYALMEDGLLREVNLTTGATVSTTSVLPLLPAGASVAGGIAFDLHGEFVFVASGAGSAADSLAVLRRSFSRSFCDGAGNPSACPCGNAGLPGRGCQNSFATGGGRLTSTGLSKTSFDTLVLHADGLPPSTSCLFFQGTAAAENPMPFGDGVRCATGIVVRLGTRTTSGGEASYGPPDDERISVKGGIPGPGAVRRYQAWYRNTVGFCTPSAFNLTNGVEVTWLL